MGKTWKCTSIWKAKSDERFIFFRLNQPCCFFYIIVPFMLPFTVEETNIPCCLCIYSPTVYVMSVFQPPLSIRFALIYSAWDLFVFSEYLKDDSTLKHKICLFYKAKNKTKQRNRMCLVIPVVINWLVVYFQDFCEKRPHCCGKRTLLLLAQLEWRLIGGGKKISAISSQKYVTTKENKNKKRAFFAHSPFFTRWFNIVLMRNRAPM